MSTDKAPPDNTTPAIAGPEIHQDLPHEIHQVVQRRFSLIWLVPIVAGLIGIGLGIRTWLQRGPTITITFNTAEGLEKGATEVRYKDVVVGKVSGISLSEDDSKVRIEVALVPNAARLAVEDTNFWVVRPQIGIGGISGISTLLSGAYIGVDVGRAPKKRYDFVGLEKPPAITHDQKGSKFTLHTADAGSINIGSPVYYRKVAVGQVVDAGLDADGRRITVQVFVEAPYDRFVTRNTRFWNAGGVDLAVSSEGVKLNTQSLATVLAGGIAFRALDDNNPGEPAPADLSFNLYPDIATALAPDDGPSVDALLVFRESIRGLNVGTPVDFQGIVIGVVKSIEPQYDTASRNFYSKVLVELFLERLGPAYRTLSSLIDNSSELPVGNVLRRLIEQGLHGQMRAGNLLTGQQYIALFFKPGVRKTSLLLKDSAPEIPTTAGSLEEIQTQIESIVTKLDAIPFEQIGSDLGKTIKNANEMVRRLDQEVLPEAKETIAEAGNAVRSLEQNLVSPDSALQQDTRRTLEQVNRTAASFRALAEYLELHPETLLRGRSNEPEPQSASPSPAAAAPALAPLPAPIPAPVPELTPVAPPGSSP